MITTTASSGDSAETRGSLVKESVVVGVFSLSDFITVSNPLPPLRMSSSSNGSFVSSCFICWVSHTLENCKI